MTTPTAKRIVTAAICCLFLGGTALAAPPEGKGKPDNAGQGQGNAGNGKGSGKGNSSNKGNNGNGGSSKGGGDSGDVNVTLRHAGITITTARGYAEEYGLSGYGSLPPGIRKNLARGKPLPPGIAKKMVPGPMLARLPVYPGYEWRVAGSDLILVAVATAIVADVLFDVFD
ncbi:anti-virulence regulator CigR family protein [Achromobacter sp. Bel]|uniref:anti-virulence regulator CigR family protein n=1 Tax=Achromobacter sp. Bel TaxID=2727415 RepID=UPI00145CE877|nr:anti-virulence regulator CigR family protein [Achromobacter sp. Bel]NMK47510.1 RcnB family protein [Achromobacter sp. Bel]